VTFQALDWLICGLFLAGIFALGFSVKLRNSSAMQFIVAGRALTLPVFVTSLVATWYGGILGIGESVLYYGLGTWLLLGVPYYVFAIVYALAYAKRVRAEDQISLPERLTSRFGKGSGLIAAALLFLIGLPAAHVLMLGTIVQSLTGWELGTAVLVATLAGSLFLYRGGLLADVRVSVLAFVMMYVGFAVIVGYCLLNFPRQETWATIQPETLHSFTGGQGPLVIVSFFILGAWTLIDPGFHQRVAAAASPEVSQKGVLICTGFWVLFDLLSVTAGMYGLALITEMPENPLLLFPMLGDQVLPSGLKAVFMCGMVGTILCSMVGYALVGGASLGRDLICQVRPSLNQTMWTRVGIAVACLVSILLALQLKSVVAIWYAWGGIVVGALLIPVTWSYLAKGRIDPVVINLAMTVSAGTSLAWLIYGYATDNPLLMIKVPTSWLGYTPIQDVASIPPWSDLSIGTLVPGLLVSAAITAVGHVLTRGKGIDGPAGRTEYAPDR